MSNTFIPYGRQSIDQTDIDAVTATLRSDFLTQGPRVGNFEDAVRGICAAKWAFAVNSATSALHIACLAAGLSAGKTLWTVPISFVASANCGRYCGADVDFVDIDPKTYCISIEKLEEKLAHAKRSNALPDILVAVDFAGQPCDMERLLELKKQYGFTLIEDAAHALGATWSDIPVGRIEAADMTIFSFHPVKLVATGEGGMVVTDNEAFASRLELLRSHGITRDPVLLDQNDEGPWYYEQQLLGFNFRMTDLQAALGISQLKRLPKFLEGRRKLAAKYKKLLTALPVILPFQHPHGKSAWHLYVIQVEDPKWRRPVFEGLRAAGIGAQVHYIPIHLQPYYRDLGFQPGDFPNAEAYYSRAISLPLFPDLTDEQQEYVVDSLAKELGKMA